MKFVGYHLISIVRACSSSDRETRQSCPRGQVPSIWTRVEDSEPDAVDIGAFFSKAPVLSVIRRRRETGLESWLPSLEPEWGEPVISKSYPSAFTATELNTRLQLKDFNLLVICGVSMSGCVLASGLAQCLGCRPMVCTLGGP